MGGGNNRSSTPAPLQPPAPRTAKRPVRRCTTSLCHRTMFPPRFLHVSPLAKQRKRPELPPQVLVPASRRPPGATIRTTGYGPPTTEMMATRVGTGPVTWDKAPGTWGGSNPGHCGAKALPHNKGNLDDHLTNTNRRMLTMRAIPTFRHPTRTGCLLTKPIDEFDPPLTNEKVSYATIEQKPETSSQLRQPFDLQAGLPLYSQSAADERKFNSFWYGTREGDASNHRMALDWTKYSLNLKSF